MNDSHTADRLPAQPGGDANDISPTLLDVATRLATHKPGDLDDAIRDSLAVIGRQVGIDRACLITFSDDKKSFTMTHEWHGEGIHSQIDYFVNLPVTTFPWTGRQLMAGQAVPISRLGEYPPEAEMERQICIVEKNLSILFVPILIAGQVVGTVAMDAIRAPHDWTHADISLLSIVGNMMAAHVECRRLEQRMEAVSRLEREKLGRDLHDSLGQQLVAVSLLAASLKGGLAEGDTRRASEAARISDLARAVVQTARDMTQGLRPFDVREEGLKSALGRMAKETSELLGADCHFEDHQTPPIQDPEACTQLFWIAREATNNAIRHGKATAVTISLRMKDHRQSLTISDNGCGLPPDWETRAGVGLKVMKFRAAVLSGQIIIAPGQRQGTRVTCLFPVPPIH
jgi:signal transduction histidine kinase